MAFRPSIRSALRSPLCPSRRAGRVLLAVVALVAVGFLTGCQADVGVDVTVEEDGSGLVLVETVIDAEASDALLELDPESDGLPLRDLFSAGWDIEPTNPAEGGTSIRASKRFGNPAQFGEVMDELSSDSGVFRDFTLVRNQSFGRVDYAVRGTIDTSAGFEAFADPGLEASLGRDLASIAESYGAELSQISIEVEVALPGELQEDASNGNVVSTDGGVVGRWSTTMASQGQMGIILSTARRSITAQVLRGVAVVTGVVAGLIIFGRLVRWLSTRGRRKPEPPKVRPADAMGRRPREVAANEAARTPAPEPGPNPVQPDQPYESFPTQLNYRVVALDGPGVLYREGSDIDKLLIPFARSVGSIVSDEEIAAKAKLMSLGRITSTDFWTSIGVPGDTNQLDSAYLANHQLMPGVVKYLRWLREQGVRAACITNDGTRWATKLRSSHSLGNLIDPWVVSGSVGVRKPDPPIYEVLRRVANEPAEAILVVDDRVENLNVARDLGFQTAWFTPTGNVEEANDHEIWRRFVTPEDEVVTTDRASGTPIG